MGKWRKWEDDSQSDKFDKFSKIRRKKAQGKFTDKAGDFELAESEWKNVDEKDLFRARVVEVHKRYAFVSPEPVQGEIQTRDVWLATLARKFLTSSRGERNFVVVGDRVLCRQAREGEKTGGDDLAQCAILHRSPRISEICRMDPSHKMRMHLLASNVEQMIVVASFLSPKIRWGLLDRCLVLAEMNRIPAVIVLNKKDLFDESDDSEFKEDCLARMAAYERMGYPVYSLQMLKSSTATKANLKKIKERLSKCISMVVGHSGVGKSTLVNMFKPELEQHVEPDADIFYKGRHTTSFASFLRLGTGGYLIDTPGVRSFAVGQLDAISLTDAFREFRPYLGRCKFRECAHADEPDCAIRAAVEQGEVAPWRYHSFRGILGQDTGREGRTRELNLDDESSALDEKFDEE